MTYLRWKRVVVVGSSRTVETSDFDLSLFPLTFSIHTGDSLSQKAPKNSKATGRSVHQKLSRQAKPFTESATSLSLAPRTREMRTPTSAAETRPMPRKSWKIPVPRPRASAGSVSVRYIGMTTAM